MAKNTNILLFHIEELDVYTHGQKSFRDSSYYKSNIILLSNSDIFATTKIMTIIL